MAKLRRFLSPVFGYFPFPKCDNRCKCLLLLTDTSARSSLLVFYNGCLLLLELDGMTIIFWYESDCCYCSDVANELTVLRNLLCMRK